MSRPKLLSAVGVNVKIQVPAEWFTTISIVSRKTYNQLVTIEYDADLGKEQVFFANTINSPGKLERPMMTNTVTTEDLYPIAPQEDPYVLDLNVYFSTTPSIRKEKLADPKYKSNRLNIMTNNKPAVAPPEFPDYTTYLIFVEDQPAAQQVSGAPEYDDSIITVNIIKGVGLSTPKPPPPLDTSSQALAETGKEAVEEFINQYTDPNSPGPYIPPDRPGPDGNVPAEIKALPVCILGAGVAGLYIAMMLDSLGIKYELMEGSGRTGGRLFTHNFPNRPGKYQYYDVGAMRYPTSSFMNRTFDLAKKRLGLEGKLLPYLRASEKAFKCYNNISWTIKEINEAGQGADKFNVSVAKGGSIPEDVVAKGSGYFWDHYLGELRDLFVKHPFKQAFDELNKLDHHSVTSYLMIEKGLSYDVVKWYETVESRTGLFDASLTETVLASLVFNDPNRGANDPLKWFCFDGGSEIVHKAMEAQIKFKPVYYQRAVAIRETDNDLSLTVTFDQRRNPRPQASNLVEKKYSNVISTMSFGCLRMVDLDKMYMSDRQRNAIRELTYTPSIKIGMQFKSAWWERLGIEGGQSSTDRSIRDVVYPSYGPDESHPNNKRSNCMIASYNGMQDSQRLGGLMKGRDSPEEKVLLDLVMRDLAVLHRKDVQELWNEYEDYFPWDFYRDEFQLGAFCQFGPGQFKNSYPYVTQPASKTRRFHFAGDATSTFHGWVAGALNSAWRAVLGMLMEHPELNPNPKENIVEKFKILWGASEEWDEKLLNKHLYVARELTKMDIASRSGARGANTF